MENSDLANSVAKLCLEKYSKLTKSFKPNRTGEWTLLAGISVDTGANHSLISLGTGSKCIGQSEMSPLGDLLNDGHAEVMARRGLLKYLYDQIRKAHKDGSSEVFASIDEETGKCVLRESATFHMFLSHTPCGDASIIPKRKNDEGETPAKRSKCEDVFRTGAKCVPGPVQDPKLPGVDYHSVLAVRTKPGRGEPTSSLSCSDKLAKWSVLGLQGALLTLLIDRPIYLTSITVASNCPYSEQAMCRAITSRVAQSMHLPAPFRVTSPKFLQCSLPFPDGEKSGGVRPCPTSCVWYGCNDTQGVIEIAVKGRKHGCTKKVAKTPAGWLEICKNFILKEFCSTIESMSPDKIMQKISEGDSNITSLPYSELKAKALEYQQAWKLLKGCCFPEWPTKPVSLAQFTAISTPP
ncbi:hypothetical protein B566_EDAN008681 [Ephemera danica]|nr:hypothetical protein B566_EDAN008681 [Ephemera danica]